MSGDKKRESGPDLVRTLACFFVVGAHFYLNMGYYNVPLAGPKMFVETAFRWGGLHGTLPLVRMEGISHVIVSDASPLFALKAQPAEAEEAVKAWCAALKAEGLGLMFLQRGEGDPRLTPLVYIPGSATVFWESSCASGSSAVGMALAAGSGRAQRLTLAQPGGRLQVESDPESGETWLYGRTALLGQYDTEIRG
jgi:hypothetical protein